MVPAVVNALDDTAPAKVPPTVLALVRGPPRLAAAVSALGAEEGLGQAGVDEEFLSVAARHLLDPEPLVLCVFNFVLEYIAAELGAVAVSPVLAADVAEPLAAGATGGRILSASRFSLFRAWGRGPSRVLQYSHYVVAPRCSLDDSPTLFASLPAHVDQIFLHRLLLEVLPTLPNVWVSSAEGAGASPAAAAEAYLRELVHFAWRDVFAAFAVTAEELSLGGVVCLAVCYELDHIFGELLLDLWAVDVDHPSATPRGPALAVLTGVADELGEAVPAVAVGAGRRLLGGVAADDADDD